MEFCGEDSVQGFRKQDLWSEGGTEAEATPWWDLGALGVNCVERWAFGELTTWHQRK